MPPPSGEVPQCAHWGGEGNASTEALSVIAVNGDDSSPKGGAKPGTSIPPRGSCLPLRGRCPSAHTGAERVVRQRTPSQSLRLRETRRASSPRGGAKACLPPFGGGVAKRRRGRTANRHPVRNCTGCLLMLNSNYSVQDLFKGEMFGFCHCEPVTDVTGVAIRSSQRLGTISEMFSASGGRIATPVCSLARNDGVN